jgi:hypothetical protein
VLTGPVDPIAAGPRLFRERRDGCEHPARLAQTPVMNPPRIPALTRSALHRCLARYGVSRVPPGLAEPCRVKRATTYAAINQTLFVFAKVMKGVSPYDAADFLEDLQKNAPAGVSSVITSDHEAFGHPAEQPWEPKFPQRIHPFIKACRASHIGRTVEKSSNSTRMMMMKGWRDVVLKLREARRPRRSVIGLRGDFDAQTIRSIAEELKDRPRERLLAVAAIFDGLRAWRRQGTPTSRIDPARSCPG